MQDLQSVDLEEFKYGGTNITALRLVDPNNVEVQRVVKDWMSAEQRQGRKIDISTPDLIPVSLVIDSFNLQFILLTNLKSIINITLQAETALMYDAVHLFAKALHDLDSSQRIDIKPLSCDAVDTWPHGYSLINYMKIVSVLAEKKKLLNRQTKEQKI